MFMITFKFQNKYGETSELVVRRSKKKDAWSIARDRVREQGGKYLKVAQCRDLNAEWDFL